MDDDDEVGYRKPPKRHQFRKGQSGNPRGREHGSQNVDGLFLKVFNERVTLTIEGKRTRMSMGEALALRLVNSAVAGSARHAHLLLRLKKLELGRPMILWMHESDKEL